MSGKLDYEKDKSKIKPKEPNTDGPIPLNIIGQRPIVVTPKTTESEAKREMESNREMLTQKLVFIASEKFDEIISTSKKNHLLKEIEDLIHKLRASTYPSACLPNGAPLIREARFIVERRRSSLPSEPPNNKEIPIVTRNKDRVRKKTRTSKRRMG